MTESRALLHQPLDHIARFALESESRHNRHHAAANRDQRPVSIDIADDTDQPLASLFDLVASAEVFRDSKRIDFVAHTLPRPLLVPLPARTYWTVLATLEQVKSDIRVSKTWDCVLRASNCLRTQYFYGSSIPEQCSTLAGVA